MNGFGFRPLYLNTDIFNCSICNKQSTKKIDFISNDNVCTGCIPAKYKCGNCGFNTKYFSHFLHHPTICNKCFKK